MKHVGQSFNLVRIQAGSTCLPGPGSEGHLFGTHRSAQYLAQNRGDFEAHPEKYEGLNWYVGSIMLIGDLVE